MTHSAQTSTNETTVLKWALDWTHENHNIPNTRYKIARTIRAVLCSDYAQDERVHKSHCVSRHFPRAESKRCTLLMHAINSIEFLCANRAHTMRGAAARTYHSTRALHRYKPAAEPGPLKPAAACRQNLLEGPPMGCAARLRVECATRN